MDKLASITDVLMIGNRLTTILAEARAKTDMRLQVKLGFSEGGTLCERYAIIVIAGPGQRQPFDIGERDFKFLRWTGVDVEVVAGPTGIETLGTNRADSLRRTTNGHRFDTGQLVTTE